MDNPKCRVCKKEMKNEEHLMMAKQTKCYECQEQMMMRWGLMKNDQEKKEKECVRKGT